MATKKTEEKEWIWAYRNNDGSWAVIEESMTESTALQDKFEDADLYRIDPIHAEKVKIEQKIVKA